MQHIECWIKPIKPQFCLLRLAASQLSHLSVAYNALGRQGIANFIMALPPGSLHHFNATSSCNEKDNQSAIHSLVVFMEVSAVKHEHLCAITCPTCQGSPIVLVITIFFKDASEPLILTIDWVIDPLIDYTCQTSTVLSELVLGDCNVGNKEIEILFKATHVLTGLHHLDLSCNCIGNEGIIILSRFVLDYHSIIY